MRRALQRRVRERARDCCEYCCLPQAHDPLPFHVEHIVPKKHRGRSTFGNLSLACMACNLSKSSNLSGLDPQTGELTPLFNPRTDDWNEHFVWSGPLLIGQTAIGRTTVDVLNINDPERVKHRRLLIRLGVFPSAPAGTR